MLPSRVARAVLIDTYPPSLVSVHIAFSLQNNGTSLVPQALFAHHCIHQDHHRSYCFNVHRHGGCFPFSFVNFLKEMMSAAKAAKLDQFGTANYNTATYCSNSQLTSLVSKPTYDGMGTRLYYQLTYNRYSNWNTPIHIMPTQHISCHCSQLHENTNHVPTEVCLV